MVKGHSYDSVYPEIIIKYPQQTPVKSPTQVLGDEIADWGAHWSVRWLKVVTY